MLGWLVQDDFVSIRQIRFWPDEGTKVNPGLCLAVEINKSSVKVSSVLVETIQSPLDQSVVINAKFPSPLAVKAP
jgi:hypothetical protein